MHPHSYVVLRDFHRAYADEDSREQRRIYEAALDANEVIVEQASQGRFASIVARVRDVLPRRVPQASRPMEPSSS